MFLVAVCQRGQFWPAGQGAPGAFFKHYLKHPGFSGFCRVQVSNGDGYKKKPQQKPRPSTLF